MAGVRRLFTGVLAGTALVAFVSSGAAAQNVKMTTAPRLQSIEGVDTFKTYCAACHGESGKGNGPAATALKKAPADLTGIAKRHGGKFSAADVEQIISGSDVIAAHGSRVMPIWGPVFEAIAPDPTFAKLRVSNLIDYLKSIQAQ
jgi:mono/diheme cytochrome c family protein